MDIDSQAPVITRDEILIYSDVEAVWSVQTDFESWPKLQADVEGVMVSGELGVGTSFQWRTGGLDITSTVRELQRPRRIVWDGPANGIFAVHLWTFERRNASTIVRTAESWAGPPIEKRVEEMQRALNSSLHAWLANLKRIVEVGR